VDEVRETRTFCRLCLAACGLVVTTEGSQVVKIRGDRSHLLSHGYSCAKGRSLGVDHHKPSRLSNAFIGRRPRRKSVVSAEATRHAGQVLATIVERHGRDAIATYRGNSAGYDRAGLYASRWFMTALGSQNSYSATSLDGVAKVAVSALMSQMRSDTLIPIIDFDECHLGLIFGSNPVVSHGHDWALPDPVTVLRRLASRGELWVIDPRRTETAVLANHHLAVRPGSDHALLAWLIRELLIDGADTEYLTEHAVGVEALRAAVEPFDEGIAVACTGIDASALYQLLATIRRHGRLAGRTGTGASMSSNPSVTEWLLWSLHVVTGSFERPGGCWFQPDFFVRADRRSFDDEVVRPSPAPSRPELRGWRGERSSVALIDEIEAGNVRALIVFGGNPLTSFPEPTRVAAALDTLDALVVADTTDTDTCQHATHVLPCLGQLERSDLNASSRYARLVYGEHTAAVLAPVGDRRALWWYFNELGRALGLDVLPPGRSGDTDDAILAVIAEASGVDLSSLEERDGPLLARDVDQFGWVERRVLPDGRWDVGPVMLTEALRRIAPLAGDRLMLTCRRHAQHINVKLVDILDAAQRRSAATLAMHPTDAAARGLKDGDIAVVSNENGSVSIAIAVDDSVRAGTVALVNGLLDANVNHLVSGRTEVELVSGMPLMSQVAVDVERHEGVPIR
jgi:anaerobic selenocysteine-containing dehydrogenase